MMKKVQYTCPKCENRVALLGIFGPKSNILAILAWPRDQSQWCSYFYVKSITFT